MSHVPDITGALNEVIGKGDPFQGGPGEDIDEVFKGDETPFSRSFYAEQADEARKRCEVDCACHLNPHDYVPVSERKAYVTRFEGNAQLGAEPLDVGNDVLIVDPSVPAVTGRIALDTAFAGPPGFLPSADRAVATRDQRLWYWPSLIWLGCCRACSPAVSKPPSRRRASCSWNGAPPPPCSPEFSAARSGGPTFG